mmetsp:Transcript_31453/g.90856  ORF Transcript_31453/g.90856 Transcript_31453/m.90856 type:complete len:207 (-) Transcript_31453:6-626(-)
MRENNVSSTNFRLAKDHHKFAKSSSLKSWIFKVASRASNLRVSGLLGFTRTRAQALLAMSLGDARLTTLGSTSSHSIISASIPGCAGLSRATAIMRLLMLRESKPCSRTVFASFLASSRKLGWVKRSCVDLLGAWPSCQMQATKSMTVMPGRFSSTNVSTWSKVLRLPIACTRSRGCFIRSSPARAVRAVREPTRPAGAGGGEAEA